MDVCDMPTREWEKLQTPERLENEEIISRYCVSVFIRNGYRFGCEKCVLKDIPKNTRCHGASFTDEEIAYRVKLIKNSEI